jgi:hypothetical protein
VAVLKKNVEASDFSGASFFTISSVSAVWNLDSAKNETGKFIFDARAGDI